MSARANYFDDRYIGGIIGSYKIMEIKHSVYNPKNPIWVVECVCGKRLEVIPSWAVHNGITKCECGARGTGDYSKDSWDLSSIDRDRLRRLRRVIINRCYNINDSYYKDYGKIGVRIQKDWLSSLDKFIGWSIDNGYRPWFYLKRYDKSRSYTEKNCYWGHTDIRKSLEPSSIDEKKLEGLNVDINRLKELMAANEIREEELCNIEEFLDTIYNNTKSKRPVVRIRKEINKSVIKLGKEADKALTMIQSYNISNGVTRISKAQDLIEQISGLLVLLQENLEEAK